jgi:hypothetical protein
MIDMLLTIRLDKVNLTATLGTTALPPTSMQAQAKQCVHTQRSPLIRITVQCAPNDAHDSTDLIKPRRQEAGHESERQDVHRCSGLHLSHSAVTTCC